MHTTYTAQVNVIDGRITVDDPASEDWDIAADGTPAAFDVEPWGFEEYGMERADEAIAQWWTRVTEWVDETGSGQYFTAQVAKVTR